jgi:signal transduction histidine kinase
VLLAGGTVEIRSSSKGTVVQARLPVAALDEEPIQATLG